MGKEGPVVAGHLNRASAILLGAPQRLQDRRANRPGQLEGTRLSTFSLLCSSQKHRLSCGLRSLQTKKTRVELKDHRSRSVAVARMPRRKKRLRQACREARRAPLRSSPTCDAPATGPEQTTDLPLVPCEPLRSGPGHMRLTTAPSEPEQDTLKRAPSDLICQTKAGISAIQNVARSEVKVSPEPVTGHTCPCQTIATNSDRVGGDR